jgi:demethoxyubiquinone hydroxylase (CLK1/Coq7/Cat5 family)
MQTAKSHSVDVLNSFLRGEISAVETYRQALEKIDTAPLRAELQDCLRSHETRVSLLKSRILSLGGAPASSSGAWGSFAKLVEGGAKMFGEKAAISALEEGEDHGRDDYRRDLQKLDLADRPFIASQVLPEQERTHQTISLLKRALH